jgi:hypothetical protein
MINAADGVGVAELFQVGGLWSESRRDLRGGINDTSAVESLDPIATASDRRDQSAAEE